MSWREQYEAFSGRMNDAIVNKAAIEKTRDRLKETCETTSNELSVLMHNNDLNQKALRVLTTISEGTVSNTLRFIEDCLNDVLAQIFKSSPRKIKLVEGIARGTTPELSIELTANGVTRSLKTDSGHGLRQIVSLLCTLSLICVTGTRRFVVLDEVLTGLSKESRAAIDEILNSFTQIGFQFVIVEHGFISKGSKVYELKLDGDISSVVNEYIEPNGFYLSANTESSGVLSD